MVEITKAGSMVMLSCCVVVCMDESVTRTLKSDVCEVVGVPEITPVLPSRKRPTGRLPDDMAQE